MPQAPASPLPLQGGPSKKLQMPMQLLQPQLQLQPQPVPCIRPPQIQLPQARAHYRSMLLPGAAQHVWLWLSKPTLSPATLTRCCSTYMPMILEKLRHIASSMAFGALI